MPPFSDSLSVSDMEKNPLVPISKPPPAGSLAAPGPWTNGAAALGKIEQRQKGVVGGTAGHSLSGFCWLFFFWGKTVSENSVEGSWGEGIPCKITLEFDGHILGIHGVVFFHGISPWKSTNIGNIISIVCLGFGCLRLHSGRILRDWWKSTGEGSVDSLIPCHFLYFNIFWDDRSN